MIHHMIRLSLRTVMKDAILYDAMRRDITTARRVVLLEILWNERYLTRAYLIARVELRLGRDCFGSSAWQDTFYRDLRIVKQAFEAAGYRLLYSRKRQQPGYYLDGQPALSAEFKQMLKSSAAEVDQRQIDIYRKLSFAERFYQAYGLKTSTEENRKGYLGFPTIYEQKRKHTMLEIWRVILNRRFSVQRNDQECPFSGVNHFG